MGLMRDTEQVDYERLGMILGLVGVAWAAGQVVAVPALPPLPLSLSISNLPPPWLLPTNLWVGLTTLITFAGVSHLLRHHAHTPQSSRRKRWVHTILPTLFTLVWCWVLLPLQGQKLWVGAWLAGIGLLLCILVWEYTAPLSHWREMPAWQGFYLVLIHLTALLCFTQLFQGQSATLAINGAIGAVSALLIFRFWWQLNVGAFSAGLYAGSYGILITQVAWVLTYWQISSQQKGGMIFITFFLLVGISHQHIKGRLNSPNLLIYGLTATGAFLLVLLVLK